MDIDTGSSNKKIAINRLNSLDGLRGWAALAVVLGHLTLNLKPFNLLLRTPLTDTKLAVGVFFIISGFVLSYRFIGQQMESTTLFKAFFARYVRLTIPVAVVSLLVLLAFHFSLLHNVEAQKIWSKWAFSSFYAFKPSLPDALHFSFWEMYVHFDDTHTYIPPSWTMGIELRGSYFIYAIVFVAGFHHYGNRRRLFAMILGVLAFLAYFVHYHWSVYFLCGYLLAEFYKSDMTFRQTVPNVQIAFLGFIALMIFSSLRSADRSLFLPLVGMSFVVVWTVLYSQRLSAFFSNRLSCFLGKISFPLYLIHVPIYCSFSSWLVGWLVNMGFSELPMYTIVYFSSVSLAIISAYLLSPLESFAIYLSRRINRLSFPSRLSVASLFTKTRAGTPTVPSL